MARLKRRGLAVPPGLSAQDIQIRLAYIYLGKKKYEQAQKAFENACRGNPLPECHKGMGEIFYHTGRWLEAVGELTQAIQTEKGNPNLYGLLGAALSKLGENEKAAEVFKEGSAQTEDKEVQAQFHRNLGALYLQMRNADAALAAFQYAVAKKWDDVESHYYSGIIFMAQNLLLDARESFKKVLELSPGYRDTAAQLRETEKRLANAMPSGTVELHGTARGGINAGQGRS
jgi:tetratricopeptide (TPR) repeat protein